MLKAVIQIPKQLLKKKKSLKHALYFFLFLSFTMKCWTEEMLLAPDSVHGVRHDIKYLKFIFSLTAVKFWPLFLYKFIF